MLKKSPEKGFRESIKDIQFSFKCVYSQIIPFKIKCIINKRYGRKWDNRLPLGMSLSIILLLTL